MNYKEFINLVLINKYHQNYIKNLCNNKLMILNYKVNKEVKQIIQVLMKLKRKIRKRNYEIIYLFFYIFLNDIKMSLSVDNEYEYILNKI